MNWFEPDKSHHLDRFQQVALGLMAGVTVLTFVATNAQALWWQSSDWLVSTVLPAVVVDLTNDERGGYATAPLHRNATLDQAATQKAQHMAANGYFAHFAPDGTSPWDFFDQAGYTYAYAGENLAIHFTDSAEVVEAWMNSPAHKENIVNGNFTEIGVGTAKGTYDGYDTVFVVQLFGTPAVPQVPRSLPAPQPAIVIEDTASQTLSDLRAQLEALQSRANTLSVSEATQTPEVAGLTQGEAEILSQADVRKDVVSSSSPSIEPVLVRKSDPLVIETELATSSGLAIAQITRVPELGGGQAGTTIASFATRPNLVLDIVYSLLISGVLVLLSIALLGEARRLHYVQAVYSLGLLAVVSGLWFVHTLLTSGAIIL